jgi:predicted dehydrogenase
MKKISLGIIGTGIITEDGHWPVLKRMKKEFEIVAVANHTLPKALAFAKLSGCRETYTDYHQILQDLRIEAVLICLPIYLNAKVSLEALAAGKHVLCEKPIAPTVAEALRAVRQAKLYRKVYMIAENAFFDSVSLKLKQMVKSQVLGRSRMIHVFSVHQVNKYGKYGKTVWRQSPRHVGGYLSDGGVHITNVVRECFGVPLSSRSTVLSVNKKLLGPIDSLVSVVKFQHGVVGSFTLSFALSSAPSPLLQIFCESGSLVVDSGRLKIILPSGKNQEIKLKANDGFEGEWKHFYEAVRFGRPLAFTPEKAHQDLLFADRLLKGYSS